MGKKGRNKDKMKNFNFNEDYWRIILGITNMVIFAIVGMLGIVGLSMLEVTQPKALDYKTWWLFFEILPIFIIGISLYIMGLTNWIRIFKNKNKKESVQ